MVRTESGILQQYSIHDLALDRDKDSIAGLGLETHTTLYLHYITSVPFASINPTKTVSGWFAYVDDMHGKCLCLFFVLWYLVISVDR